MGVLNSELVGLSSVDVPGLRFDVTQFVDGAQVGTGATCR